MKNLAMKHDYFGELEYSTIIKEMKDKALSLLIFIVIKRNGTIKTRGVASSNLQRNYISKEDYLSPTPNFYT